ncbi:glycosyltransferase family 2 protein [uncultured Algibacter sp.]|uniref:glycosyltransferase family 2 protein n=1 Tax=uncultured Algibacter sp. TaxID=298659 RepID=UPI002624F1A8|nr:glycosyltransferase family 2 protein [uncultured Algibacter sp.]
MKLSVIILNYNVQYFLELCLRSVEAAILNIDAEIIVVDNNSEDDSCQMVKSLFPNVSLIENKDNYGFSKGNNIGVLQAKGEYLCILNPDTVVAEDTFLKVLEFSENKKNLGIVGCKLINGRGDFLPESKRKIPYVNAAFKKLVGNSDDYYANAININEINQVEILVGAFMFLKKAVYNEIEGFDEDYFMYGEDIDISYKALKKGYVNYYYGKTTVLHFKGESTLRDKNYARRFYGAMQIFYKKHFKKNVLFDLFVWGGIRVVYFFRKQPINKVKKVFKYIFISNSVHEELKRVLNKEVVLKSDIKNIENNSEIIFDANVLSFKNIISFMETNHLDTSVTFKILPKNSKFVIGSDDAVSRGEVINF